MRMIARLGAWALRRAGAALLLSMAVLLVGQTAVIAQRQGIDPRRVSLTPADLPRGFAVVERETTSEPLRTGPTDADIVGVTFRTVLERPRSIEHLQSGPVKVSQMIARSDDPARATFSLDAQREYNLRENGYEPVPIADGAPLDDVLCLVRHDGPFVEYRIDAVKNGDTLVSTTAAGLPSALNLDVAVTLTRVSLARYDTALSEIVAAQPPTASVVAAQPPSAPAAQASAGVDASMRAVATPTPVPAAPMAPVTPTAAPGGSSPAPGTAQTPAHTPPSQTAQAPAPSGPAPKVRLPADFDDRLTQPWSELMASTATTASGEKLPAYLKRIVEKSNVKVLVGNLSPNVGGELKSVASMEGGSAKIIESTITINKGVMSESPRVLAAMLAHEIVHAGQPVMDSRKQVVDCLEAEVEAYAVQARVWAAFWGDGQRPGGSTWERSTNYIAEVWHDSGESGLRQVIRDETGTEAHSCVD